jgi:predicted regulator of Ras-like GTPase activity (Roadblock/LC7/MglB family)
MKVSVGPIAKPGAGLAAGDKGNLDFATTPEDVILQEAPTPSIGSARTALQVAFDTDETLDAKSIVACASRLPGVSACAIVFSDGLSLAGNIPTEYEADALCALAPSIVKRIDDQMIGASLGPLNGMTLYCAKTPVSFFAHGNICLAALHSADALAGEIRARLSCVVRELAQMYAQPA